MGSLNKIVLNFFVILTLASCASETGLKKTNKNSLNQTTTPRDIMNAKIANRTEKDNHPYLTVGKFVELAERYQSCQCTNERFVDRWEKTKKGYLLYSYFNESQPIEFICNSTNDDFSCFIREIDRGHRINNLNERFAPGSSLVKFIYDKGVRCLKTNPCQ